jgi:hypothetical protein
MKINESNSTIKDRALNAVKLAVINVQLAV